MSITSKSQTENSEEYLNKLLSLSNDDFVKLTNKKDSTNDLNTISQDNSLGNDSKDKYLI
ncbi:MAG: hypothetical protein ACRDA5_15010 [Clostridium sp.]